MYKKVDLYIFLLNDKKKLISKVFGRTVESWKIYWWNYHWQHTNQSLSYDLIKIATTFPASIVLQFFVLLLNPYDLNLHPSIISLSNNIKQIPTIMYENTNKKVRST